MPELPEVETVRRGLDEILKERPTISQVKLARADIRFPIPKDFAKSLRGRKVVAIHRRAKFLLIETDRVILLSHLGMTGSWRVETPATLKASVGAHDHCFIELSDGRTLVYRDPRRFGVLDLVQIGKEKQSRHLKNLGPEPLDEDEFTATKLFEKSRKRKIALKTFIMDQRIVVGVGNIYASEVLFRAKIKPQKAAGRLTLLEAERLVTAIREILKTAISAGGSSIRDYKNAEGESGSFQNSHQVYERAGEACRACGTGIRTKVLGGRSTYWCPNCQR